MGDARLELAGERVLLLPERALLVERTGTLLVADAHWGKAAAFRAAGVAVPGGTTAAGLARLSAALERTGARRLVFLGDLLHAREGRAPATLAAAAAWRARHPEVEMMLVRGNHDRGAGDPPEELGIACADPPREEPPFVLLHHPAERAEGYALAGHLHPGVRLAGAGRQRERLPCFWLGARVGVLPAFGDFTGMAEVRPAPGDRVFVVAGGEVVEVA
ncbi:MAG TPA: ligase-associated DNA damage response endonuclease PdeM [Longimicrobiaceae bacterium]